MKKLLNYLIIGCIFAILYIFVGHGYVVFYFGGKTALLELATSINNLCNENNSCPVSLAEWEELSGEDGILVNSNMVYLPSTPVDIGSSATDENYSEFTLVYGFFTPDQWFEAKGGVGKDVIFSWNSRDIPQ